MAAFAEGSERFVEIPGIVEIRWISDDPDYYVEPEDLFDKQAEGLPDWYGTKNKTTTEQAFFNCNICECELKSVVTLRAHCKGTQHVRKALQKKKEYRDAQKKKKNAEGSRDAQAGVDTSHFTTLIEWLDSATSEAVVGLEHVTEYKSGRGDPPYYHCRLESCQDEQGNAEAMKNHLFTLRHKQAWLLEKTGEFHEHQSVISQRIADFTKDFRRDYRVIEEVVDRDFWEKCRRGRLTSRREGGDAPRKREIKEETGSGSYREWKRSREDSGKNYREDGERNHRGDGERNYRGEDPTRSSRDGSDRRERSHVRMNEEYSWQDERSSSRRRYSSQEYHRQIKRESEEEYSKRSRDRSREEERWGSSLDTSHFSNDSGHGSTEGRGRETYYNDEDLEEVGRSGDFANWRTAVVKRDVESRSREEESSTSVCPPPVERSDEEDIERLHKKVRDAVCQVLNRYWPDAEEYMGERRIEDDADYRVTAKEFSHKLRHQIKESYFSFHNTLKGIALTSDHKMSIKMDIQMEMEKRPLLNRRHR